MITSIIILLLCLFFAAQPEKKDIYTSFLKQKPFLSVAIPDREYANSHLSKAIIRASKLSGLPDSLIDAIITVESSGDINAVSSHGAVGPMQVTAIAASIYPEYDRFDPHENILIGSLYLASLLEEFGSLKMALAAYNYGPTDVKKNGFRAVNYVNKIKKRLDGELEI